MQLFNLFKIGTGIITKYTLIILFIIGSLFTVYGQSKIESLTDQNFDTLYFPSNNKEYFVFVYNSQKGDADKTGSLQGFGTDGTTAGYNFDWDKFNNSTLTFDNYAASSAINNLTDGLYRLIVTNGGTLQDTLFALVFCNAFDAFITNKDINGELDRSDRTCDNFWLKAEADFDSVEYFDPFDNSPLVLHDELTTNSVTWEDDGADEDFSGVTQKTLDVNVTSKVAEDTEFTLRVETKYGNIQTDQVKLVTIQVKADFNKDGNFVIEFEPKEFYEKYYTDSIYSAPFKMKFVNTSSSKVDSVLWKFNDGYFSGKMDSVRHVYLRPGTYNPGITVMNSKSRCLDSVRYTDLFDEPIEVVNASDEENRFTMPNIFVIDGVNLFRSYDVSVDYIEIVIVSRWGQLMHEYRGNIRDWKGWDGKIKGSNRYVKPGVYFYFIKYLGGWESSTKRMNYGKNELKGFFHVYYSQDFRLQH